mmetsp:Transcript_30514/g.29912  ORF Transcript_30514/g.29912 Transcript_30514/m.29912 type:complete len:136 (-) Transcript_30514:157-564(-)
MKERVKSVSVDDERDPAQFKLDIYNADFNEHKETRNQISSVMSAMVNQIAIENSSLENDELRSMVQSQQPSIDDLFEDFNKVLGSLRGEIKQKSHTQVNPPGQGAPLSEGNQYLSLPSAVGSKRNKEGSQGLARS